MPKPTSVTMFTSMAPWRTSALVPVARSSLTVNSDKTRSKSLPRTLPVTHRHRARQLYPYRNRSKQMTRFRVSREMPSAYRARQQRLQGHLQQSSDRIPRRRIPMSRIEEHGKNEGGRLVEL